jgi:heme oxygenase (biliverdin-IX-beta and delta-forming)
MSSIVASESLPESRAKRLKALTHATHDRLDRSVVGAASFATVSAYARFVEVQFLFHRDIDALYGDAELQALLPGLESRGRLPLLAQDLIDLGIAGAPAAHDPAFIAGERPDIPVALGWLYVAEGSRVGGALLRKEAARLGLSDTFGARHLAPAAQDGPAAYWRMFTSALDAIALDTDQEARVIAGANAAFARVQAYVDDKLR